MKRSRTIELGAVAAIASLVLTACGGTDEQVTADCVEQAAQADGSHRVVDDRYCDDSHGTFVYIYGGGSSRGYVRGGTTVRPTNATITTRSGKVISRGGFGGRGTGGS
ncbi:hypothetical protein ACFLIM_39005 [Nonomuraea sp. M3C6]|uniref:Lipoprotein n=1 Tax=Nonomuraea marmarensis TaxID=3351344 RepID=A0ABW7AQ86_9ACTN